MVSKDWAKWKGRGPSPGTGKNGVGGIRREPQGGAEGSKGGAGRGEGASQEEGTLPTLGLQQGAGIQPLSCRSWDSPVSRGA